MSLIQHHTKYLELDGEDEIVLVSLSEHRKHDLERGYAIPKQIINKAHARSPKGKLTMKKCLREYAREHKGSIEFTERMMPQVRLRETFQYCYNTGQITCCVFFQATNGRKLYKVVI